MASIVMLCGFLTLGLLAGSCQGPPAPSAIPPGPDVLTIAPALDGIKVGTAVSLTAVLLSSNATRRTVPATWSSEAPEIATIRDDGRISGITVGKTAIRAGFEGLSALQPLRVVRDYEGTWNGDAYIVNCSRISGRGPDVCRFAMAAGPGVAHYPIRAVLTQNGLIVTGTLEIFDGAGTLLESGPVDGPIDDSGSVVIAGTTQSVDPDHSSQSTLSEWSTTPGVDGDHMSGRFVRKSHIQNAWGSQEIREECEIKSFERVR